MPILLYNGWNGSYFTWLSYQVAQMRETHMVDNLLLHQEDLVLNEFRIYNIWRIQWRKPCQLSGWMKDSYYSDTAQIWTSYLMHSMTMCKKVPRSNPLGHRGGYLLQTWSYSYDITSNWFALLPSVLTLMPVISSIKIDFLTNRPDSKSFLSLYQSKRALAVGV